MATVKQRVDRVEKQIGQSSGKHFLVVFVKDGESREEALKRSLEEDCMEIEEIGLIIYFGPTTFEEQWLIECDPSEIVGLSEFWDELLALARKSRYTNLASRLDARAEEESV